MTLSYSPSTKEGSLRTLHKITIDGEYFETTRAKELLIWAKPRIFSKFVYKELTEAVRLGKNLEVSGGGLFDTD